MRTLPVLTFAALLVPSIANADWRSTNDSTLVFEVSFEGEPLQGTFPVFTVELDFDPGRPAEGRLVVIVDVDEGDMGDEEMNDVLDDPAWLDAEHYAVARFESSNISAKGERSYLATGDLNLKGKTKSVEVPFEWQRDGNSASMQGTFALRRTDFDVGSGEWSTGDAIGLDVVVTFDVELAGAKPDAVE